jgi:hypothetical protein
MPASRSHREPARIAGKPQRTLELVPNDLTQSRRHVRVDLSTFSTHTFGNLYDTLQTRNARAWLEVQVGEPAREDMRWADFAIRASKMRTLGIRTAVAPTHDGTDVQMSWRVTVDTWTAQPGPTSERTNAAIGRAPRRTAGRRHSPAC